MLFIQAHEADLVHGPQATDAAESLEVPRPGNTQGQVGSALIEWGGGISLYTSTAFGKEVGDYHDPIWVDRYVELSFLQQRSWAL